MEIYQIQHKPLPYYYKHSVLCEIPIFLKHLTKYICIKIHMYQKLNKVVCILKQCFFYSFKIEKIKCFSSLISKCFFLGFENFPIRTQVVIYQKWVYFTFPLTDYKSKIIKLILNVTSDNTIKTEYFIRKLS